jgi:hypothetical protein
VWYQGLQTSPAGKLTKVGAFRKRKTLSLARLDHYLLRNAQLEMVNAPHKTRLAYADVNGIIVLAEDIVMFKSQNFHCIGQQHQ